MTDEVVVPFSPLRKGKPEQLTREQLKGLSAEEINAARLGGHLEDLMKGVKPSKPEVPLK